MLQIFCDGGARGNPGPAAYGFVVFENGKVIYEEGGYIGIATNNFAEYTAVISALSWLKDNNYKEKLNFFLDSKLVVSQVNGLFKVKSSKMRELLVKVRQLETSFETIRYNYIPRDRNQHADYQVNKALDEKL